MRHLYFFVIDEVLLIINTVNGSSEGGEFDLPQDTKVLWTLHIFYVSFVMGTKESGDCSDTIITGKLIEGVRGKRKANEIVRQ